MFVLFILLIFARYDELVDRYLMVEETLVFFLIKNKQKTIDESKKKNEYLNSSP